MPWWGETCSGACNKPWEGRRWGKGGVELAAKFPSTFLLPPILQSHICDRPFDWPAEIIEGKALWKCPWRSEGLWVLCKQHKVWSKASKKASLSWPSSLTSFPLWGMTKQAEEDGGKQHWIFSLFHGSSSAELVANFLMCRKEHLIFSGCFSPQSPVPNPIIFDSPEILVTGARHLENEQQKQ